MENNDAQILIGSIDGDHVLINPIQREREDTSDYHDRNWVTSEYVIVIQPWSGIYNGTLFAEEIARFSSELTGLYDTLQGTAEFNPMEPYLTLLIEGDGVGHFVVEGEATAAFGSDTFLTFSFTIDQTQLKETLSCVEKFKKKFSHLFAVK